jgi:hypothetical protein
MRTRHHPVSENVTLDRIDFEKLKEQAQAERAEYLRQHGTAASGVVGSTLRAHHVIAVAAILLISFGAKMFFLSAPTAEAEMPPSASMNILQMQIDHPNNLPAQQMHDMTFVEPLP